MGKTYGDNQLLKVEIKSKALFKEDKKSFVTYFKGGTDEMIIHDLRQLYPQYMKPADDPVVNITPISKTQYNRNRNSERVNERQQSYTTHANVLQQEDFEDEDMAN